MKLPFVTRSRHNAEITRQKERTARSGRKLEHAKKQAHSAKTSAQRHKGIVEQLREERLRDLEHIRRLEQICEIRAKELESIRAGAANPYGGQYLKEQIQGYRDLRSLLAMRLAGEGIEIGALHRPLPVLPGVVVRYVDLRSREDNIGRFPEVPAQDIVETTYICDGQSLSAVPDASQDFVIANHMLEHCVNPLLALQNFLRVLRPAGRLFLSLPDKRFTFDFKRSITPWEHVLRDYQMQREVEEWGVYEEYRQCVDPGLVPDEAVSTRREIHHHAWTQGEILELFINARRILGWPLEVELFAKQGCEVVLVMQKIDPPIEDHAKLNQASSGS